MDHIQFTVHYNPQLLFCSTADYPGIPQSLYGHAPDLSQVQDFTFVLTEFHSHKFGPFLQFTNIILNPNPNLQHNCNSTQFGIICNFAKYAFNPYSNN